MINSTRFTQRYLPYLVLQDTQACVPVIYYARRVAAEMASTRGHQDLLLLFQLVLRSTAMWRLQFRFCYIEITVVRFS